MSEHAHDGSIDDCVYCQIDKIYENKVGLMERIAAACQEVDTVAEDWESKMTPKASRHEKAQGILIEIARYDLMIRMIGLNEITQLNRSMAVISNTLSAVIDRIMEEEDES